MKPFEGTESQLMIRIVTTKDPSRGTIIGKLENWMFVENGVAVDFSLEIIGIGSPSKIKANFRSSNSL